MRIIGFNLTKILAEKAQSSSPTQKINTNIEFINLDKEKIDILKDNDVLKISFKFSIFYTESEDKKESKQGEIAFEGNVLLSTNKEESKEALKSWKKKELPSGFKIAMFNVILKKCTTKALFLEEEINLPSHIPFPQVSQAPKE